MKTKYKFAEKILLNKNSYMSKFIFFPLSLVWSFLHQIRRTLYDYQIIPQDIFRVPIISVGNITFGGTGKTPMVIHLIEHLNSLNLNILVLSRGYGGQLEHSCGILKAHQRFRSNPLEFGDEPLLIARRINKGAIMVGKKRSQNFKNNFHHLKPDVVLLDDGFQYLKLFRHLDILLFDATMPLSAYHCAPLGYLRESLSTIKKANCIMISRANLVSKADLKKLMNFLDEHRNPHSTITLVEYRPTGLFNCYDTKMYDLSQLDGLKVIALSALGSPSAFYQTLENFGMLVVKKYEYPDHHFYHAEEISQIFNDALIQNAIIVTTEKDMVKIKRISHDRRILYLGLETIMGDGKDNFYKHLKEVLDFEQI